MLCCLSAVWLQLQKIDQSPKRMSTDNSILCCSNHLPEWHLWYADFSKALSRVSSSGDYKRTWQGALAALLLYLYKYNVVCATTISTSPYAYVHTSTSCPITKATMPYTCALMSYSLISTVYVCTMCTPWGTYVSWRHS